MESRQVISENLKGHGNEVDFLGFLQKLVSHRSLTLPFEPFCFWLRIRGDIRNQKQLPDSSRLLNVKRKLGESESRRFPDSANSKPKIGTARNVV